MGDATLRVMWALPVTRLCHTYSKVKEKISIFRQKYRRHMSDIGGPPRMTPGIGVYAIDDHFDEARYMNLLPTADDDEPDEDPQEVARVVGLD